MTASTRLELLLLAEEHGETDDRAVDQETAYYRHDHGGDLDGAAVRKDRGESCKSKPLR